MEVVMFKEIFWGKELFNEIVSLPLTYTFAPQWWLPMFNSSDISHLLVQVSVSKIFEQAVIL